MAVAYLTDVEGRWDKLVSFLAGNPHVRLDEAGALHVADGHVLVFGGDAVDRGEHGLRVVRTLLDAKRRQPDRVVLLAGNRDINKLRLRRELSGDPPRGAPEGAAGPDLLRWIFERTMGARVAFEMRRAELGGVRDDDVVASFVADVGPGGTLVQYLAECQLVFRYGATLFVHGAVTAESLGHVPGEARVPDVDAWASALNRWYGQQMEAFQAGRPGGGQALIDYQAPLPGTRQHQASVVYGRLTDATSNPRLPGASVIEQLRRAGIQRLVAGHTPVGDSPAVLRAGAFEQVMADNSYSRMEVGARLVVDGDALAVHSCTRLDDGSEHVVRFTTELSRDPSPIGARDVDTGHLVTGRLGDGRFLLFVARQGFVVEQVAMSPAELADRRLAPPE